MPGTKAVLRLREGVTSLVLRIPIARGRDVRTLRAACGPWNKLSFEVWYPKVSQRDMAMAKYIKALRNTQPGPSCSLVGALESYKGVRVVVSDVLFTMMFISP